MDIFILLITAKVDLCIDHLEQVIVIYVIIALKDLIITVYG